MVHGCNRTRTIVPARGVDATMTFDAADRIAASAEATYTTDTDGFVTSKEASAGTTTYRYSALGELEEVTLPSGRTITYAYDAFSRRVSRSVDGTLTERYLWADATHLLAVYPAQGTTPTYRFTYADGRVPASVQTSDGAVLHLITDQVGTVRALVASDGAITSRVERDSHGAVTSGRADFPLGFAGGLADADTGLTHFGAREYDPALGRWMSRDPIDFAGGDSNLYGYVLGDPVGLVDPSGLWSVGVVQSYDQGLLALHRATMGQGIHYVSNGEVVTTSSYGATPDFLNPGTWEAEMPGNVSLNPVGIQVTNAECPEQLTGRVESYGIDLFFLSLEGWRTEAGIWSVAVSAGVGLNPINIHGGTQDTWLQSR